MKQLIPILRVADAHRSARLYCEHFGFSKEWEHQFGPGYPWMISLLSGAVRLFLSEHKGTGTDNADIYVYVDDVSALHSKLESGSVTIEQPPADQEWGVREMKIRDLDGHRFTFGTPS